MLIEASEVIKDDIYTDRQGVEFLITSVPVPLNDHPGAFAIELKEKDQEFTYVYYFHGVERLFVIRRTPHLVRSDE